MPSEALVRIYLSTRHKNIPDDLNLTGLSSMTYQSCTVQVISPEFTFFFFFPGATQPIVGVYFTALYRALASLRTRLLDHTQRRVTVGRTPLNEWQSLH